MIGFLNKVPQAVQALLNMRRKDQTGDFSCVPFLARISGPLSAPNTKEQFAFDLLGKTIANEGVTLREENKCST